MDNNIDEEEKKDALAAKTEGRVGVGGDSIGRILSAKEWEQIETVSHTVRQVGVAMQAEATLIAQRLLQEEDVGDDIIEKEKEPLHFCVDTWEWLRAGGKTSIGQQKTTTTKEKKPKHSGGVGGRAALVASLENKARAELLKKVEASKLPNTPAPRIDVFGKRVEAFAVAMEGWAVSGGAGGVIIPGEQQQQCRRSLLDVVVSCNRAAAFFRTRCGGDGGVAGADAIEAAAKACVLRCGGTTALLEEAVSAPDPLVRPSFAGIQQVSLYPEQKKVARELGKSLLRSQPLLMRYITPPSGGKSSAAALFGATLAKVLEIKKGGRREANAAETYVIYACFSNAVRVEVARTILAAGVPFAVVTAGLASPSFSCFHNRESSRRSRLKDPPPKTIAERVTYSIRIMKTCDKRPIVLVCDLESAYAFRSRTSYNGDSNDDVLLLDELTVGSEPGGSHTTTTAPVGVLYSQLLRRAARYTVLMSATVPEFDQLPELLRVFNSAHEHPKGVQQLTASSKRLSIGVEARDLDGKLWLPHHTGAASVEALVGGGDEPDGHLMRFYGPEGVRTLLKELDVKADDVLTMEDFISHDALRSAALRILKEHRAHLMEERGVVIDGESDEEACEDATGLATNKAWQYPGCTLVVSGGGADAFYRQAMQPLLAYVPPLARCMVHKPKERKERSRKPDSDEDTNNPIESVAAAPVVRWPVDTIVNSREHFERHKPPQLTTTAFLARKNYKHLPIIPEYILETSAVPLVESALSGVVLLDSSWSDRAFELCGLALADSAQPSYVVSDTRLVYGVNLPVNRVLVLLRDDALGIDEVRQLCGRAGRTGKCAKAEIVFRSQGLLRLALSPKQANGDDFLKRAPLDLLLEETSTWSSNSKVASLQ